MGWAVLVPIAYTKPLVQPVYACRVTGLSYPEYMWTLSVTVFKVLLALVVPALMMFKLAKPDYKSMLLLGAISLVLYSVPVMVTVLNRRESQLLMRSILPAWAVGGTD